MEKTNSGKANKLVDRLIVNGRNDSMYKLCDVLSHHHPWCSRELMLQFRVERGEFQIDPAIQREAAIMVHRSVSQERNGCLPFFGR